MSVKTEVLKLLEASRERDLSGQEMAESLGVTRSAIWKAVNTLKKEGYQIQAVNNRGYRLKEESDVLSEEGIRLCLHKPYDSQKIKVFKCIDSTNMEAKRCALNGEGEGLVILAEEHKNSDETAEHCNTLAAEVELVSREHYANGKTCKNSRSCTS